MKTIEMQWLEFAAIIGMKPDRAKQAWEELEARYAKPERFYHTLHGHIGDCMSEFREWRCAAKNPFALEAALWLHDAIYQPGSDCNEELSARWAVGFLIRHGATMDIWEEAGRLILFTKHDRTPKFIDEEILCDIDLLILAATEAKLHEYEEGIRKEYEWVPEEIYRQERIKILSSFLARPRIFHCSWFSEQYEARARESLEKLIERLEY